MWLLLIRSPQEDLLEYKVKPHANTLGRQDDNDLVISDTSASRYHTNIEYDPKTGGLVLIDQDSKNGTYLNGKRISQPQTLEHEDRIRIGHYQITVVSLEADEKSVPVKTVGTDSLKNEVLLESIDRNAILLYEITRQLNELPDVASVIAEASEQLKRIIGADICHLILEETIKDLKEEDYPLQILKEVRDNQTASITSNIHAEPGEGNVAAFSSAQSTLCAPILIGEEVFALVYAVKNDLKARPFDQNDLQLVLVIGYQAALIVERKKEKEFLLHHASHDPLTNLPNRNLFLENLNESIEKAKEQKDYFFAMMFIDIDNFKIINDSIGHLEGDQLLIQIAKRLKENLFNEKLKARIKMVARFSGDEFGILIEDIKSVDDAVAIANLAQEQILTPFDIFGREVFSSASIGIALGTTGYQKAEDMLRDADIAMFRAKELGKARHMVFNKTLHERLIFRLKMQTALRQAANQDEFRLHYQPIISLETGSLVGFEALIRWQVPGKDLLYPNEFFSDLDTTGLLSTIDFWVLREACLQLKVWQNDHPMDPPLFMSINLSGKQIAHPNLVDQIREILEETELKGENLWLEITETDSMENSEATLKMMADLQAMNLRISIDDFGTGFSSLNYLQKFPIDALKIDRTFISGPEEGNSNPEIVTTILTLAKNLGLSVVAEGVESEEQLEMLRALKCEYAQGFYFSEALESAEAAKFINKGDFW